MEDYYRVGALIDIDAVRDNVSTMKALVPEDKKILVVLKANAYGHGAIKLAREIDDLSDYYGLAIIEEAIELRNAGVTKPLLILGRTAIEEYYDVVNYDITIAMFSYVEAKKLSEIACSLEKTAKIHIAIDTGMSRIGYLCDKNNIDASIDNIEEISKLPNIFVEGIFTHYAKADEYDKTSALAQLDRFKKVIEQLEKRDIRIPIKHISNSAGIMEMPNELFDMIRCGITTYGLYPSEEMDSEAVVIKPAMSIKTHIAYIKTISKGVSVGYGGTFTADDDTVVATIPVGYADGYPRALSNIGRVIINGQYASIIGRVCMDQFMVDITHIKDLKIDDEVILVGEANGNEITVEELANPSGSFNYEFVCNVSRRVPRVYVKGGKIVDIVKYI